jgi:exopolyphosphatase/guanosine-5'-triphosphate,3'-diphosphate pyrophosphatase
VPDVLAAVDLGSNSFHLVVARYTDGQLIVLDRLRESVRLAEGVDDQGRLDKDVAARALACLRRFGQRLEDVHASGVRVVGTSALRQTRNRQPFLDKAREALGHRIEIISGREEARLIYSGVAQTLPDTTDNRLVVDIGGGSTEMIIGRGAEPLELESMKLGCVGMSARYFGDGKLSGKRFARARLAAQQELEPVQEAYLKRGWNQVAGSSGTVRSILEVQKALDPRATAITADGIEAIIGALISAGSVAAIALEGVTEDRRAVFPGGVAILAEIFAQLGIEQMRWADGAMREGLLYDMVGRYMHEDARERTVRSMQQRYHVDLGQAQRVEQTAVALLEGAGRLAAARSAGRTGADLGLPAARDRTGCRAQWLSPPRRLPARERRHAGLRARGTTAAGATGGRTPAQVAAGGNVGPGAALGHTRHVPGADTAPGSVAASESQHRAAAHGDAHGQAQDTGTALQGALVPRSPADRG